jgi:hypothetical protein
MWASPKRIRDNKIAFLPIVESARLVADMENAMVLRKLGEGCDASELYPVIGLICE